MLVPSRRPLLNCLAELVAVALGCPRNASHLWNHVFHPEALSSIPGFMVNMNIYLSYNLMASTQNVFVLSLSFCWYVRISVFLS